MNCIAITHLAHGYTARCELPPDHPGGEASHQYTTTAGVVIMFGAPEPASITSRIIRERIQQLHRTAEAAQSEIERIARSYIDDFHFLNFRVSRLWTCDVSPIGMCVLTISGEGSRVIVGGCRYCKQPADRK